MNGRPNRRKKAVFSIRSEERSVEGAIDKNSYFFTWVVIYLDSLLDLHVSYFMKLFFRDFLLRPY